MENMSIGRWGIRLCWLVVAALLSVVPAGSSRPRATELVTAPLEPIALAKFDLGDLPEAKPHPNAKTVVVLPVVSRLKNEEFEVLADYLAREYSVPLDETRKITRASKEIGEQLRIDPLLLIAIIAVESSFNAYAVSDYGAAGLMQIVPRFHANKLVRYGGEEVLWDPEHNIRIGAEILVEYARLSGTTELALQRYNGAADDASLAYARRVGAHLERFARAARRATRTAALHSTALWI